MRYLTKFGVRKQVRPLRRLKIGRYKCGLIVEGTRYVVIDAVSGCWLGRGKSESSAIAGAKKRARDFKYISEAKREKIWRKQ